MEASAVARQVYTLAVDHARELDAYAAWAGDGLRGPAGRRMLDDANRQRQGLHRALLRAWASAEEAARRGGEAGLPLAEPILPGVPFGGSRGDGSLRGVDEHLLRQAISAARTHGNLLCDAGRRLTSLLSGIQADPSPGYEVQAIGDWLLGQQYELRRRIDLARAADAAIHDMFDAGAAGGALERRLESLSPADLAALAALQPINALPPGRDRARRTAAWWASLPVSTQVWITQKFPRTIGALDGIPSAARNKANRAVLTEEIDGLEAALEALPLAFPASAGRAIAGSSTNAQRTALQERLSLLKRLESRLNAPSDPPMLLLGFDTKEAGKAIVSHGDPDTSDHVVTLVPGFGTKFGGVEGNFDRVQRVGEAARRLGRGQTTAAIYWFDYRPPQPDPAFTRVGFDGLAKQAVEPLGGFLSGLEASRATGQPAHTALMGHSYGSLAVGKTVVAYPNLADELILVGSPGVGVDHARDLKMDPERVYVGAAGNDWVARWLPPKDPRKFLETGPDPDIIFSEHGPFGTKPASPQFGATPFYAEPRGHSHYWDQGAKSLENLGLITIGEEPNAK